MRLIHGDCLEEMEKMAGGVFDLTVTSPPYDNLRTYNDSLEWGEHIWKPIIKELYRVTKPGGVVVWVVGDATVKGSETGTSFKQALWAMDCGFNLHDTMIYYRWSGPLTHNRYEQEFEYMFIFSKGRPETFIPKMIPSKWYGVDSDRTGQKYATHNEINRKLRSGKSRGNIKPERIKGNVWKINNSSQAGEQLGHPAPFPEQLAKDHILSWSNEGDTVFDPFMGSGTTGKMALLSQRDFIGIEKNAEYYDLSCKRVLSAMGTLP